MTTTAGDTDRRPATVVSRTTVKQWAVVDIGATGAPTVADSSRGVTITRTGAGAYTLAFLPATGGLGLKVRAIKTATIIAVTNTAVDLTAGTATIVCRVGAGTATDPASGDKLLIEVESFAHSSG